MILQDISMQFLDETDDNSIKALNKLVGYFEAKLIVNGKKYDRAAIKFYLVNEMIKCRDFPNEGNYIITSHGVFDTYNRNYFIY